MSSHEADPRDAGRRDLEIRRLYRARPRSRFARWSGAALVLLVALAWSSSELRFGDYFSERRMANLERFLGETEPLVGLRAHQSSQFGELRISLKRATSDRAKRLFA